jgi:hypothetical protein
MNNWHYSYQLLDLRPRLFVPESASSSSISYGRSATGNTWRLPGITSHTNKDDTISSEER